MRAKASVRSEPFFETKNWPRALEAGESRKFPVVFFISPDLPADVKQITLSYTFFEVAGATAKPQVDPPTPRS